MTELSVARRRPRIHPALVLAILDLIGLSIASYLSFVELRGDLPQCGPLHGCEQVALSPYSRIGGVPVAVFGVVLSLVGVTFEGYFTYLELFVIGAVCVWCAAYGLTLVARFFVALWAWQTRDR